ncbi:MAG: T9SS type A sorting domain-containing protein [Burkholderiales bacterium]|nr:T9SS type A sorting domain-containing protein [Bacteroidia bacterium]
MKKFLLFLFSISCFISLAQTTTVTLTASGTFIPPCGVSTITVECWGGGGGGGGGFTGNADGGGGGGGGGFTINTSVGVISGTSYNYTVGTGGTGGGSQSTGVKGGTTTAVFGTTTVTATGGNGGTGATSSTGTFNGGTGGTGTFTGGTGGNGTGSNSGGGGEGASSSANGVSGSLQAGGSSAGNGGDGPVGFTSNTGSPGSNGNAPGGGASGGTETEIGGTGGRGEIRISYINPPTPNAGVDQISCTTGTFALSATAAPNGFTGAWTCSINCTGISFSNASSATSSVSTVTANTAVTIRWALTHTASGCTLTDNAVVSNSTTCPPVNDNCLNATPFPAVPTNGTCANLTNQSTAAASNSSVTPSGACTSNLGTPDDDVWFSFIATSTTQILSATRVSGVSDIYWQVFSSGCGATMIAVLCTDTDAGATMTGLTIGNTYYVKMYTYYSGDVTSQNICISTTPPPPTNNNCSTATPFPAVPTNGTCSNLLNQYTTGASNSNVTPSGACTTNGGTPDDDVWFSFVATSTSQLLSATYVSGNTDVYWQVFSGNCGGTMTAILCTDNNAGGIITGLTIGNTYFIRLYTWSSTGGTSQNICIAAPPPPPSNDNCAGATAFPVVPTTGACATLTNQSTNAATNSSVTPSGACTSNSGTPDDDVWFSFVATSTTQILSATYVSGASDIYWQVFSGICGGTMTSLLCTDNNAGGTITGLTVNQTYYVRLFTWSSAVITTQNICIAAPPPPPPNDDPCAATAAAVNSAPGTCTVQTAGTISGATSSGIALGSCLGTADDDIWFSFVANATSMNINLNNVVGSTTDLYHSVYAGVCGSLGTALICSDPNSSTINGLSIGNTYYVRIYSSTSISGQNTTFSLCINPTPPPPTNTTCNLMQPICSGSPYIFQAQSGGTAAPVGPNYGCLTTKPNPTWFYLEIATPGTMEVDLTAGSDVDFAMWGPYADLATGQADCSSYPLPIDCSYSSSSTEQMNIANAQTGEVYIVLVTNYANIIQNITLNQSPGASATTNCAIILPVGLLYFNTYINENEEINLEWATETEQNNDYFELQKSSDGYNWSVLATKDGKGNSISKTVYNHVDQNTLTGITYYRLKQVDFNLSYIYSNIISIDLSKEKEQITNVRPNPTKDLIYCDVSAKTKGNILIEIINYTGEVVFETAKTIEVGHNSLNLDLMNVNNGVYLLKVKLENTGKILVHKIIKN